MGFGLTGNLPFLALCSIAGRAGKKFPRGNFFASPKQSAQKLPYPEETAPGALKGSFDRDQAAPPRTNLPEGPGRAKNQPSRGHLKLVVTTFFACREFDKCIPIH